MTSEVRGETREARRGGGEEPVLVDIEGPVATVTLNAPGRLNALNVELSLALQDAMIELDRNEALRAVIIRGAGERAFAAGADISEFSRWRSNKARARIYARILGAALDAVEACRHPTIALIRGACVGGGLGVAAQCDLRVCGRSSRFGVPVKRLLEILLLGEIFGAEDALRLGLVNRVVDDEEVEGEAWRMARSIAAGAPLTARWHKRFVYRLLDPAPLTPEEEDEGYECYDTEDFQRGYRAFLAKEDPEFVGR